MSAAVELAGLVRDLDEREYHALPGLSSTGAKAILRSPAHYRWLVEHPLVRDNLDLGSAAHGFALGTGWEIATIPDDALSASGATNTKAAKEFIASARRRGAIPLKSEVVAQAKAIAEAVKAHPVAGALFTRGEAEVSMFWTDAETGVDCRGRLDYLRNVARPIVVDLKTCQDANPEHFGRTAVNFGYDVQAAFYSAGYEAITGAVPAFLHVLVEVEPPHAVSVVQLDDDALYVGRLKARAALERYRDCTAAGVWPAYPTDITPVSLPGWALTDAERKFG